MSEGGPSAAEMGITQKDLSAESKPNYSKAVLPTPPVVEVTVWGKDQNGELAGKKEPYTFQREQELPPQEQFSDRVKNMILTPMRGELDNGNLANFLRQLNKQKGIDSQDKLGVVLLINDNAKDREQGKHVIDENHVVSRYVSLLGAKDFEGIGQLDVPQEYKELAKEIIDKDQIEIRQDYLHANQRSPHFGLLREHLFREAKAFKSASLPDNEIILHLSDIDITYTTDHFQKLKNFYVDPAHQGNLTEQDFLPGVHEGEKEEDISKDLLSYLDEFRLYSYGRDIKALLSGKVASGTPIISGRMSFFDGKELYGELGHYIEDEDFFIGEQMTNELENAKEVGNVGEVYRQHRARNAKTETDGIRHTGTDADEAYALTRKIRRGAKYLGDLAHRKFGPGEEDEYVEHLELEASEAKSVIDDKDDHSERFRETDGYRELLQKELQQEKAKVRLRRMRLMNFIDSLAGNKELTDNEQKILDPYIEYFQDETDAMKQQLSQGKTPEQVAVSYMQKYNSFFNPDTPIHTQIARLRALKKYTFEHTLLEKRLHEKLN